MGGSREPINGDNPGMGGSREPLNGDKPGYGRLSGASQRWLYPGMGGSREPLNGGYSRVNEALGSLSS